MSPIIKSDGLYATCCGDKILLRRQRFLQKFSRINEAICRCYVSLACVASVSVWKDRGTGLSVLGAREMERQPIFAQKRWQRRLGGDATRCCNYSPATWRVWKSVARANFVPRLKFMIIVPSMNAEYEARFGCQSEGSRVRKGLFLSRTD